MTVIQNKFTSQIPRKEQSALMVEHDEDLTHMEEEIDKITQTDQMA